MKRLVKVLFETFGFRISRIPRQQNLINVQADAFEMQRQLVDDPTDKMIIFDVGAFSGEVALLYNKLFPNSRIYSFEPFPESFSKLKETVHLLKNVVPINKGLGEVKGMSKFHSNTFAPTNSLLSTDQAGESTWGPGILDTVQVVDIEMTTLDEFVESQNIERIDILKLDVQGSEYMVLNGARSSLSRGLIKMIYLEIITLPTYKGQKYLDEIVGQLRIHGFDLFNFYNHSLTDAGQLRQLDAIFVQSK